jgi:hypothetical protein
MVPGSSGRVTVVTNGNYFACLALAPLLARAGGDLELQVIVTTGLRRQRGSRAQEAWGLLRRWGPRYFGYKLTTYAVPLLAEVLGRGPRTVRAACRARGLACQVARNVNQRAVRERVAAFAPDLLLSVSCPYRIKQPLLDLPRVGCLNLHSSLLPAYAGVCTYVHVLAAGEAETGITLHEMVEQFDAGRIVAQRPCAIEPGTSVATLFRELCRLAGPMIAEQIPRILTAGAIDGPVQDPGRRSYFGEPDRHDIDDLRRRGFSLLHATDVRAFWSQDPAASDP